MLLVTMLALEVDPFAKWRWVGTADERVLWGILAVAVLLAVWGAWGGWSRGRRA